MIIQTWEAILYFNKPDFTYLRIVLHGTMSTVVESLEINKFNKKFSRLYSIANRVAKDINSKRIV